MDLLGRGADACRVPLLVYNARQAPPASFFNFNYKVAAWLYPAGQPGHRALLVAC